MLIHLHYKYDNYIGSIKRDATGNLSLPEFLKYFNFKRIAIFLFIKIIRNKFA